MKNTKNLVYKENSETLKWYLEYVQEADSEQFENTKIDIYGETENGSESSNNVDVRELCGAALIRIDELEKELQKYAKYAKKQAMECDI